MAGRAHAFVAAALLGAVVPSARAFYLPGVAPHEYQDGEAVRNCAVCPPRRIFRRHELALSALSRLPPLTRAMCLARAWLRSDLPEGEQAFVDKDVAAV